MESRGAPAFKEMAKVRREWNPGGQRWRFSRNEVIKEEVFVVLES